MSWNTSTIGLKICLICMLLATVLFVIGFATNDWMTSTYDLSAWGLWKVKSCIRGTCVTAKITAIVLGQRHMEFWFRLVQIFECIGLICLCVALFVVLIVVFLQSVRNRLYLKGIIYCSFSGVAAIIIGVLIYATQLEQFDVGWSMGVAIAGAVFLFFAATIGVIELNR